MSRTGTVNYHVHKPERQSFQIDAGGVEGKVVSPELVATRVPLTDLRDGLGNVDFASEGFAFISAPTQVLDFDDGGTWKDEYDRELKALLERELGVRDVIIFDHTVRVDDPVASRRPARNVHSDYSAEGALKRLIDILGPEKASKWSEGRYAFINVWRPVEHPINSAPLGFVRPATVKDEDWILVDLVYPDRRGHIMGLAANEQHEWVYLSRMSPTEAVYFNIYDNSGHPSVAHSAIDRVEDPGTSTVRKSIESRTLVRF